MFEGELQEGVKEAGNYLSEQNREALTQTNYYYTLLRVMLSWEDHETQPRLLDDSSMVPTTSPTTSPDCFCQLFAH